MRVNGKLSSVWFLAFASVFAVLAAYVFWGAWSLDIAPVMPDDPYYRPFAYSDVLSAYINGFLKRGKILPTDWLWEGLLISLLAAMGRWNLLSGEGLSKFSSR